MKLIFLIFSIQIRKSKKTRLKSKNIVIKCFHDRFKIDRDIELQTA